MIIRLIASAQKRFRYRADRPRLAWMGYPILLKHAVATYRAFRNRLYDIPMLHNLSVFDSHKIDDRAAKIILLRLVVRMKDNNVVIGKNMRESDMVPWMFL